MEHEDDRELGRQVSQAYRQAGEPSADAKARLMARLRRDRSAGKAGRAWSPLEWTWRPWEPGAAMIATAATLIVGTGLGWLMHERWKPATSPAPAGGIAGISTTREVRLVQFVLTAPKASQVTVVGDFNKWDPQATPMARRDGGAWTAAIPVSPGRHVYAFIVDGDRWVSDPGAPLAPEDGFGIRNSVIVVGGQEST
jgi:hypothetical protein